MFTSFQTRKVEAAKINWVHRLIQWPKVKGKWPAASKRGPSYTRARVSLSLFRSTCICFLALDVDSLFLFFRFGESASLSASLIRFSPLSLALFSPPPPLRVSQCPLRYRDESAYVAASTFLRTTLRSWRVRDAFALHRVPKRPHSDALVPGISIRPPHARSS